MSNQESAEKGQSQMTVPRKKKRFFFQDVSEIKPHFTTGKVTATLNHKPSAKITGRKP